MKSKISYQRTPKTQMRLEDVYFRKLNHELLERFQRENGKQDVKSPLEAAVETERILRFREHAQSKRRNSG